MSLQDDEIASSAGSDPEFPLTQEESSTCGNDKTPHENLNDANDISVMNTLEEIESLLCTRDEKKDPMVRDVDKNPTQIQDHEGTSNLPEKKHNIPMENVVPNENNHTKDSTNENESQTSDESSSSSDSTLDDLPPKVETPILDRRSRNMAKHERRLEDLGIPNMNKRTKKTVQKEETKLIIEDDKYGMLIDIDETSSSTDFRTKYPCRISQIRLMTSIMEATIAQLSRGMEEYIPAPIFIYGASGTAKTCLTRDVVQSYNSRGSIGGAYVNCATLAPSSIEALVESAYQQIATTFKQDKNRKRKKREKDLSPLSIARHPVSEEGHYDEIDVEGMEDLCEQEIKKKVGQEEKALNVAQPPEISVPRNARKQYARHSKFEGVQAKVAMKKLAKESKGMEASYFASHGVPLAFGRSLMPFIGRRKRGCAFLILDNAERLMSLAPGISGQKKTNYLAQLLLLPKALELQLTVIVISKNALLMNSRIGNVEVIEKSIGNISLGVHPISIHFEAYLGNDAFLKILKTPENIAKIIGSEYKDSDFHRVTVNTFLGSLVQTMVGMTRDVRDMISAGRHYWPSYIEPLSQANINSTMARFKGSENMQEAILSFLDQRMMKLSQSVEQRLLYLGNCNGSWISSLTRLPYLSKCLLLACFICQHNKVDQDRKLFNTSSNGKRRKQQHEGDSEMGAYASWDEKALRALRPRSFPLERMLSVFVNIVALHDGENLVHEHDHGATIRSFLSSLGHNVFFETIGRLRLDGLLKEIPNKEGIQLSNYMYFCELGRDDANSLAESIGFQLEKYLISGS
mmetsp:Transcript_7117/g.11270  ORF Transcript_7117/g.11270 Transcript_7117/m.11270 type:complete len:802 (+) Transcript_7117:3-2408(+)